MNEVIYELRSKWWRISSCNKDINDSLILRPGFWWPPYLDFSSCLDPFFFFPTLSSLAFCCLSLGDAPYCTPEQYKECADPALGKEITQHAACVCLLSWCICPTVQSSWSRLITDNGVLSAWWQYWGSSFHTPPRSPSVKTFQVPFMCTACFLTGLQSVTLPWHCLMCLPLAAAVPLTLSACVFDYFFIPSKGLWGRYMASSLWRLSHHWHFVCHPSDDHTLISLCIFSFSISVCLPSSSLSACHPNFSDFLVEKDNDYCVCETPCNLTRYGKELSFVKIPSKASAKYLAKKFNKTEQYIA